MSAATIRRWRRRELEAAKMLGTKRVHRSRFESKPDMDAITLACGVVLQPECKTRKALPKFITKILAQASKYTANAIPLGVVSENGGEAIAILPLSAFVQLVGIAPVELPAQTAFPVGGSK